MTFVANVAGGDPAVEPTFKWTVSAGRIVSGEGTSAITVDTSGVAGQKLTATVAVGGYPPACTMSDSCELTVAPAPTPRKVGEYGNNLFKDEKARLDKLTAELENDPGAQAHFICYGGRREPPGVAHRRCVRAAKYVIDYHGIDFGRVVIVDGGYRKDPAVEFWIVPYGAQPPRPTPNVFPNGSKPPVPARRPARRTSR